MKLYEYDCKDVDVQDVIVDLVKEAKRYPIYVKEITGSADYFNVVVSHSPITQKQAEKFFVKTLNEREV